VIGSLRLGAGRLLELQRHRPGASLTPQLRGGIGGPTAGSSTTL
jgi:hypothetical protein